MKKIAVIILVMFSVNFYAQNRGIIGKWNTIDEVSGKALSVVEIFESNNKIYGQVDAILIPKNRNIFFILTLPRFYFCNHQT